MREQDALDAEICGGQTKKKGVISEIEQESNKSQNQNEETCEEQEEEYNEAVGKVDENQSQDDFDEDSQESLGTKVGKIMPGYKRKPDEKEDQGEKGGHQRYNDRLADKYTDDILVLDRAKKLAKSKNLDNNEGTSADFATVLNTPDSTLVDIAAVVGVSLGTSLEMVGENLSLLRAQEEARVNLFRTSYSSKEKENEPELVILQPMVVDSVLQDLLSLTQEELDEINPSSLDQFQLVERVFGSASEKARDIFSVKTPIRTVLRRRRSKKDKSPC
jgi:hypothetical protein